MMKIFKILLAMFFVVFGCGSYIVYKHNDNVKMEYYLDNLYEIDLAYYAKEISKAERAYLREKAIKANPFPYDKLWGF